VAFRHVVLAIAAILVFGLGVFLFVEVRSSPAAPPPVHVADREDVEPPAEPPADTVRATGRTVTERTGGRAAPTFNRLLHNNHTTTAPQIETPTTDTKPEQTLEGVKLEAVMAEANKAYDRMDFDEARSIAQRVLQQQPDNTRMLRIMVSSACIESDGPEAQKHYNLLPKADRDQMKTRCARYGVTFTDPPK